MKKLTIGSLFAGVGGFDLGFERLGFETKWVVEWEPKCQLVLRRHFPNAKIYGDINAVEPEELDKVDVITYGFPCTDVSHAGKRKGLIDENGQVTRSGLFFRASEFISRCRPRCAVFENVPGLLSSDDGRDFAAVLTKLAGIGYDETFWVTLDSQYFGVAQRRKRIFGISACASERGLAEGCAREILALEESMRWNPEKGGQAGEGPAAAAGEGSEGSGEWWDGDDTAATMTSRCHDQFMPDKANFAAVIEPAAMRESGKGYWKEDDIAGTVDANMGASGSGRNRSAIIGEPLSMRESGQGYWKEDDVAGTVRSRGDDHASTVVGEPITIQDQATRFAGKRGRKGKSDGKGNGLGLGKPGDPMFTLTGGDRHAVAFKASHYTRDKDGAPSETCPPLSADADKGDQDPVVLANNAIGFSSKDSGNDAQDDLSPTIRSMNNANSHPNGGGQAAVAYEPVGVQDVAPTVTTKMQGASNTWAPYNEADHLVAMAPSDPQAFRKSQRAHSDTDGETWVGDGVANTVNSFENTDVRTTHAVVEPSLYSIMPMNSGKDYKARKVEVTQPVMAGGPVGGNQGGDVVVEPAASVNCRDLSIKEEVSGALQSKPDGYSLNYQNPVIVPASDVSSTITTKKRSLNDNNHIVEVFDARGNGEGGTSPTLTGDHQNRVTDYTALAVEPKDVSPTITSFNMDSRSPQSEEQQRVVAAVLNAQPMVVRRLTPEETERLQGFQWRNPDGSWSEPWTDWGVDADGKKVVLTDSARYKQMGNAVTVNVAEFLAGLVRRQLEKE